MGYERCSRQDWLAEKEDRWEGRVREGEGVVQPELNQTPRITRGTRSSSGSRCRWGRLTCRDDLFRTAEVRIKLCYLIRLVLAWQHRTERAVSAAGAWSVEHGASRKEPATVSTGRLLPAPTGELRGKKNPTASSPRATRGPTTYREGLQRREARVWAPEQKPGGMAVGTGQGLTGRREGRFPGYEFLEERDREKERKKGPERRDTKTQREIERQEPLTLPWTWTRTSITLLLGRVVPRSQVEVVWDFWDPGGECTASLEVL